MSTVWDLFAAAGRLRCLAGEVADDRNATGTLREIAETLEKIWKLYEDADSRQDDDKVIAIRQLAKAAAQLVFQCENIIESSSASSSEPTTGKKRGNLAGLLARRESSGGGGVKAAGSDLRTISSQINHLLEDFARKHGSSGDSGENPPGGGQEEPYCSTTEYKDVYIGFEDDIEWLVKTLLGEAGLRRRVISLRGISGSGKTRLAKCLYNDPLVRRHFQGFGWAHVTRNFSTRRILEEIFCQLSPWSSNLRRNAMKMKDIELSQKLYKLQQEKRCLVVLDDVFSIDDWQSLRNAFPLHQQETSSKVLFTTTLPHDEALAGDSESINRILPSRPSETLPLQPEDAKSQKIHEIWPLKPEDCWKLLQNIAGVEINDAGMTLIEMMERSNPLPLAIVLLGGVLKCNMDHRHLLGKISLQDPEQMLNDIINLSYQLLPSYLKACFLYLGGFPVGAEIEAEKLYALWIAEGLIIPGPGGKLMESAEQYLNLLVSRNMVQTNPEEASDIGKIRSCWLHDRLRDFCIKKAKEEEFLGILRVSPSAENVLASRVFMYLPEYFEDGDRELVRATGRCRSVLFFDLEHSLEGVACPRGICEKEEFKSLRILHFDGIDFRGVKFPKAIDKLVLLRYLSCRACLLEELPTSVGNLQWLQTLDLRVRNWCKLFIPNNVINKITRLKYLYLPLKFYTDKDENLQLGSLKQLEIIENLDTRVCTAKDLLNLPRLQRLSANVEGRIEDAQAIISFLKETKNLQQFSIDLRNFDCYSEEKFKVLKELLACKVLTSFHTQGHIRSFELDSISQRLTVMELDNSELKENPMAALGKLPLLRILVLSNDACVADNMVCSEDTFLELRILKLGDLHNLKTWTVEKGSMKKLSTLTIERCPALEKFPEGLMQSLRDLKISGTSEQFKNWVRWLDDDREKKGNFRRLRSIKIEN